MAVSLPGIKPENGRRVMMDRPNLSCEEIVEILVADAPWHPLQVHGQAQEEDDEEDPSANFWRHAYRQMAQARAQHLLESDRGGALMDRQTAKDTLQLAVRRFGYLGIPLLNATAEIESAVADVLLAISSVDFFETHMARWDRLRAIVQTAAMYYAANVPDFIRSGIGREMILRLSTSPEAFREHQRELMDAKRPELLDVYVERLNEMVRRFARQRGHDLAQRVLFNFPRGNDFWAARAWWMHWVEVQIERVWPGCALGERQEIHIDA